MNPFRRLRASGWVLAALVLGIGWFYFWTAAPEWSPDLVGTTGNGYYNLLTRGLMKGELCIDAPADPFLATLKNASDPVERGPHGMHDMSYYRGRYYLYFGVTPALVLFLPFRLLTGHFIDESLAVATFCSAGLLASLWVLGLVRRRYFPRAPEIAVAGCVLALGLATMVPDLLRRPSVWEVPISCGYACCMLALGAIFQSLHAARPARWLALASAGLGLAVGCRPTYFLSGAVLLLPLAYHARGAAGAVRWWRDRAWRRLALAALGPIAAIGLGLGLYNYLRFGSPTDFGFRHVMNSENMATERLFNWHFFLYNFRLYTLVPAGWSPYFPFVTVANLPVGPQGHLGSEDPYGILPNMPFVILGLGVLGIAALRRSAEFHRLTLFALGVFGVAAVVGFTVTSFGGADNRYMVDFLPAFVLLGCLGLLSLVTRPWYRGALGVAGSVVIAGLVAYSAGFNVLASLRHNELFRAQYPARYQRVAHRWNWLSHAFDRWRHAAYGPIEMRVIFPVGKTGQLEPLVVTGHSFLAEYLFVYYVDPGTVRFGLEHTSRGTFLGQPVKVAPGEAHTVRIDLGSLYPPAADPYFDGMPEAEARSRQRTLRVACDGQVVLDRQVEFYDATDWQPLLGRSGDRPGFPQPFSGRIVSWRRLPEAPAPAPLVTYGLLRLTLVLPPFTGPRSEPLLSTGVSGRGDLVYVHYEDANRIFFGHDHWGFAATDGAPVAIRAGEQQVIEIDCPALEAPGSAGRGRLVIRLNGQTAFDQAQSFYPCDPSTVAPVMNAIQASSATAAFIGTVVDSERVPPMARRQP